MTIHVLFLVLLWTFTPEVLHGLVDELTIRRGWNASYGTQPGGPLKAEDYFSYSNDNRCPNENPVYLWCNAKNADQPSTSFPVPAGDRKKCSCQCQYNYNTFLSEEQTCVNETFLKNKFGEGTYFLQSDYFFVDLMGTTKQMDTQINSDGCKIKSVQYYFHGQWKEDQFNTWNISKKGVISWTLTNTQILKAMQGKILKISLKSCKNKRWWSMPPIIFAKAIGHFTYPPTPKLTSTQLPGTTSQTGTAIAPSSTSSSVVPSTSIKPGGLGGNNKSSPAGAIVGAILAVAAVIAIIVLVIIWRRRKSRQNEEKKKDTNKDNPAYGKQETINLSSPQSNKDTETSEFEYDYAAVDGDPRLSNGKPPPGIYQSLVHDPNTNRESVYTPLDRQQGNPNEESASYDTIDHPVFKPAKRPSDPQYNVLQRPNKNKPAQDHQKPSTYDKVDHPAFKPAKKPTDPQYNVLQRPNKNKPVQDHTYLEPGAQIDPVYNVLEDPNTGGTVDEPEYNVLEGPNSGGANDYPDYNVLEDPNPQYEPEYHILEDPQNNGPPKGHPSSRDNIGYASTIDLKPRGGSPVYAAPDGPISEPTYQPLTVNAPDDSVYQPLDRTSRNIPDNDQPVYHVLEGGVSDA